jgi:hypothetical protein
MNIYFSKIIKAGERQREFNFRKLPGEESSGYHVDVTDDRGNRLIFSMYRNVDGHWKTTAQKLPLWIHNSEEILGSAIEEELKALQAVAKR